MAVKTKTIGASSRDYPTLALFWADIDDGSAAANDPTPYAAGDDAVGVLYNDAPFLVNAQTTFTGGDTVGLASVTVTVDPASRHGGVFGAGVVMRATTAITNMIALEATTPTTVEDFEIDGDMLDVRNGVSIFRPGAVVQIVLSRMLIRDSIGAGARAGIVNSQHGSNTVPIQINNCVVRNFHTTTSNAAYGFNNNGSNRAWRVYNCSADDIRSAAGSNGYGFRVPVPNAFYELANCIAVDCDVCFEIGGVQGLDDYHTSSDASANGVNSNINQGVDSVFVDRGALDYTLQASTPALNGTNLGSGFGVNVDAAHRDRVAEGDDPWSQGALQFFTGVPPVDLVVQDSQHAHGSDALALDVVTPLTIQGSQHRHASDEIALEQANTLAVADSTHGQRSDALDLVTAIALALEDVRHFHASDQVQFVQASLLTVASAQHSHRSDVPQLTTGLTLTVAPVSHGHSSEQLELEVETPLVLEDVRHVHASGNVDLVVAAVLEVLDSRHAHRSTQVIILDEAIGVAEREGTLVLLEAEPLIVIEAGPIVVVQ